MKKKPTQSRATLDRIEDEVAVLIVDGQEVTRPLASLPEGAREGDVIHLETMTVDPEATEALREEVRAARERAKKGKTPPPGDFDL
ncbi:DUF3006 domain-containing protein [Myxococcus faecalis]|uniref:DUF3006 domain-containing protein n=1 Tax=Myxococcus TaxID=32 RepID=UPI001CBB86A6|nr:DUF3006 domain-containing protein [Myxococcus sp. AS-1-15]MBZ4410140.1 DUF3006 domain-containing protein [Myxococcus sp. XM-1-1-1]BDT36790.1 DUF3006 domain-containing protein [Myxococcus sp. MH1]